jgi:hypothetical protein
VDKSFDKFEIYVLRNIFTVPDDLVNYMRLGHYEVCLHRHGKMAHGLNNVLESFGNTNCVFTESVIFQSR